MSIRLRVRPRFHRARRHVPRELDARARRAARGRSRTPGPRAAARRRRRDRRRSTAAADCGARKSCTLGKKSAAVRADRAGRAGAGAARCRVTLVISVLKGDKIDERRARRGDARRRGHPAGCQRAIRDQPGDASRGAPRIARWQRIAVASAKQCGRAVVPDDSRRRSTWLDWYSNDAGRSGARVLLRRAVGGARRRASRAERCRDRDAVDLIIGPEGGWTVAESRRRRTIPALS